MAQTRNPAALGARAGLVNIVCCPAIDTRVCTRTRANTQIDFGAINRAALAALPAILARLLPGGKTVAGECVAFNPTRVDRRAGSFKINLRSGRWADFATSDRGGDPVSLVAYLAGTSQVEAARRLARMLGLDREGGPDSHTNGPAPEKGGHEADDEARRIDRVRRTWAEAGPIAGTLAERYLREHRRLALDEDFSHCVHFHARTWWREGDENSPLLRVPCLIAAYRQIDGDEIVAIQKTRLAPDGSKLARKMSGPVKGAAIKIDRDEDVTYGLIVGEGLETCLAARELGFRPCWALGSAGAIETFPPLTGIDALTILAETGARSAAAVETCGSRWRDAGREVIVVLPQAGSDINDAIREVAR